MQPKPPSVERALIVKNDHRRKYGSKIVFQVLRNDSLGGIQDITLLLPSGAIATLCQKPSMSWEAGVRYELKVEGFPTAALAEDAGMKSVQAMLLAAISLNFGIRLNYRSHEPPTVFDRTISGGWVFGGEIYGTWPEAIVVQEVMEAFSHSVRERRLILSMELFAAASLESNDRAKFVMAVSAFEPLAEQLDLGPEVSRFISKLNADLEADASIPENLRGSLRGRIAQLRRESVRQALHRLCETWFPEDKNARDKIDNAYSLRSQILHEGRLSDLDVELYGETQIVSNYLRKIYAKEFGISLRAPLQ